jgi:D5 N terminal like
MPMHKLSSLTSDDLAELMAQAAAKGKNAERGVPLPPSSDGPLPPFSDEALALRFADRHAGDLRFVAAWGKWLTWDGKRWRIDDTVRALDYARAICREAAAQCNQRKLAPTIASAKTVFAVERLARADRALPPPSINGTRTHGR